MHPIVVGAVVRSHERFEGRTDWEDAENGVMYQRRRPNQIQRLNNK